MGFDCHVVLDLLDVLGDFRGHLLVDQLLYATQNLANQLLELLHQQVVDVAALYVEHVHSYLVRHLFPDLVNGVLVLVDLCLQLLSHQVLGLQELFDSVFLAQDEFVLAVDLRGKLYGLKVVPDRFGDLLFCFKNDLIVDLHIPEMDSLRLGDSGLCSGQVLAPFDNGINDALQLVLNRVKDALLILSDRLEVYFSSTLSFHDGQLQLDKVVFEGGVGIVLSQGDFLGRWVRLELVPLDELNVGIHTLLDQLSHLVGHQSGCRLKEGFGLVLVKVVKLLPQDLSRCFVPISLQEILNFCHLILLGAEELIQGQGIGSWLWKVDKQVVVVVLPKLL